MREVVASKTELQAAAKQEAKRKKPEVFQRRQENRDKAAEITAMLQRLLGKLSTEEDPARKEALRAMVEQLQPKLADLREAGIAKPAKATRTIRPSEELLVVR